MTTKVTVDAHAGWDVKIVSAELDSEGLVLVEVTNIVPKNTLQDFYIHSHKRLVSVEEVKP